MRGLGWLEPILIKALLLEGRGPGLESDSSWFKQCLFALLLQVLDEESSVHQ